MNLKELIQASGCDTGAISGLSSQIIGQMNLLIPSVLVDFSDLPNFEASGKQVNPYLQPIAKESLRRAIQENGSKKLKINSAYRTVAQQYFIYSKWQKGLCFSKAAQPGLSNHEDGLALDISNFDDWITVLEKHGWDWFGSGDKVHFSFVRSGVRDDIGNIGLKAFQQLWNKFNPSDTIKDDGLFGDKTSKRLDLSPIDGFPTFRTLKIKSPLIQGDDVREVQQALVKGGFLTFANVNGDYDDATKTAVEQFQSQKHLGIDGVVGRQTRKELGLPT
ncbi:hypothetical protein APA_4245 [Pseudanabaena sp. lw0831]|uniref:peptidoglycan-binding protein n=1 Tax=Pseudanabaena sp. lw0831 TaxID=1357935 RepID=UPI00191649B3|nr:peptidoglycan-binding protein [Pseudanabaena sp. lw0831]GBO56039.1 hypothetical protein APA_4245 [Pseudanabaena sp. lw0831]